MTSPHPDSLALRGLREGLAGTWKRQTAVSSVLEELPELTGNMEVFVGKHSRDHVQVLRKVPGETGRWCCHGNLWVFLENLAEDREKAHGGHLHWLSRPRGPWPCRRMAPSLKSPHFPWCCVSFWEKDWTPRLGLPGAQWTSKEESLPRSLVETGGHRKALFLLDPLVASQGPLSPGWSPTLILAQGCDFWATPTP